MEDKLDPKLIDQFHAYCARSDVSLPPKADGSLYACPCCGCATLHDRGGYDICPICKWEDDGQDDATADESWFGPNGGYTLTEARANYLEHGDHWALDDPRRAQILARWAERARDDREKGLIDEETG